jgi:hypothetical protein
MIFVADGSGYTGLTFNLKWGGMTVRTIELDAYVNQAPTLALASPRKCDTYSYTNQGY